MHVDDEFSSDQLRDIRLVQYISNSISLIGSSLVIISHWSAKGVTVFPLRLAYFLSVADLFTEIAEVFSVFFLPSLSASVEDMNPFACWVQGVLTYGFNIAGAFWTTSIAFTVYRMVVHLDTRCERFERYFHAVNWGVPLVMVIFTTSTQQYGPNDPFCYIFEDNSPVRYAALYPFIIFALVLNLVMYSSIYRSIKSHKGEMHGVTPGSAEYFYIVETRISRRMIFVVLAFLFSWTWSIINRTYILITGNKSFYFFFLHHMLLSLEGLWNSLVYGDNKRFRHNIGNRRATMSPEQSDTHDLFDDAHDSLSSLGTVRHSQRYVEIREMESG
eukprot:TRINITY_DN4307_c0_g1_i2.p1 TRINITY_DN4307_c0_g1~~TRINITY_DN4307_c0_g1_i2.p1  ORF type:complete len:330 (-),score=58.66 TRINITY_DN4307_c0_g1_i2:73-1062(-)